MLPKGCYVALVTPMDTKNDIQWSVLIDLINWHIQAGTQGLVILGTTGEAPTITARERARIIEDSVTHVDGRIPVIVGAGTNSTHTTCEQIQEAALLGADACLLTTPYYNRPTQNGLYNHFYEASRVTKTPLLLYNIPARTGVDLEPYTVERLAERPTIIGIKEATGDLKRLKAIQKRVSSDFLLLSGDDSTAYDFMRAGGDGVISVIANIVPEHTLNLCTAALLDDPTSAAKILDTMTPLLKILSAETNPIPIKQALYLLDKIGSGLRLPLTPLSPEYQQTLRDVMGRLGLLNTEKSFAYANDN